MKNISYKRLIPSLFIAITLLTSVFAVAQPKTADALKGSEFVAGNIIDGSLFYQGTAMSADQIQKFLNAKVPTCDTNGTKASSHWSASRNRNYTRAEWGAKNGNPAPFKCLKDYVQTNTPNKAADAYCPNNYTGGTKTAAKIIYDVSKACNLSQKVMLVLLQKEQSFITDDWPWKVQYTKTTGYGCPDTTLNTTVDANQNGCYDEYEGFFKQIYYAARQFRRYAIQPELFNYRSGVTSYVQYNPNGACGGKNVTMQNSSTAALYNYTPYVPNKAALDDLYGSGDIANPAPPNCSSFGNRNFWRLYNDWFGSTKPSVMSMPKNGREVYRMFSTKYGKHFFTPYISEVKELDTHSTYKLEGVAFYQPPAGTENRVGVFRLKKGEKWFWTIHVSEKNNLVNKHGFKLEGTAFTALTSASTHPDKVSVYRLFNKTNGAHLFTTSSIERDAVAAKSAWTYEGVAWRMLSE